MLYCEEKLVLGRAKHISWGVNWVEILILKYLKMFHGIKEGFAFETQAFNCPKKNKFAHHNVTMNLLT